MSILFGLLLARRFYCRIALSFSPGRTGGLLPRINAPSKITPTFSVSVTVAILISDTKCGIERNDFFVVLKAEVFGRKLDSISGLVGAHIDL